MSHPYWCIWRRAPNTGEVEWWAGRPGYADNWERDWSKRERFGCRSTAMSKLWDLRSRVGGQLTIVKVHQGQPHGPQVR